MLVAALVLCLVGQGGRAEDSFLGLTFGARALALGGAYVAVADDGQAAWWNPAGLGQVTRPGLVGSQNHLSFTDNAYALSLSVPAGGWGTAALSVQHLAIENAAMTRPVLDANCNPVLDPATNQPLVELTGFGQENDASILVSWGVRLSPWLLVGAAGKALVGKAGPVPGHGFGADAGCLVELRGGWRVGGAVEDIGSTTVRWRDGVRSVLDPGGRVGVSWTPHRQWLIAAEAPSPLSRADVTTGAGVEWRFADFLLFRAGLMDYRLTGGAGFRMPLGGGTEASADYGFVTGSQYEDRNRLTLGVTF